MKPVPKIDNLENDKTQYLEIKTCFSISDNIQQAREEYLEINLVDRNLIDALCYLDMYYPHLKWDINYTDMLLAILHTILKVGTLKIETYR